jgi:hypothetical protein
LLCVCWCCQVEVSANSLSLIQRSPTDCGSSLCVIKKPRERGGHSPCWAAESEKIIINNNGCVTVLQLMREAISSFLLFPPSWQVKLRRACSAIHVQIHIPTPLRVTFKDRNCFSSRNYMVKLQFYDSQEFSNFLIFITYMLYLFTRRHSYICSYLVLWD